MSFYAQQIFTLLNGCTNFLQLHLRRPSTFQELMTHDLFWEKIDDNYNFVVENVGRRSGNGKATFFCLT